jgi:hypothetical protein
MLKLILSIIYLLLNRFSLGLVTKPNEVAPSRLFLVFRLMDTFHPSVYTHLSLVVCVLTHSLWILWALNRLWFVFRQIDGFLESFDRCKR